MEFTPLDTENILKENDQWNQLSQEWGSPVDLESEDQDLAPEIRPSLPCSTWNLNHTTFDSAELLNKLKTNALEKIDESMSGYDRFRQELTTPDTSIHQNCTPLKDFYYVGGAVISLKSVEDICEGIDSVFKSVEKLCATTSTVRVKDHSKRSSIMPRVVEHSVSVSGLSWDETLEVSKASSNRSASKLAAYVDELFSSVRSDKEVKSEHLEGSLEKKDESHSVSRLVESFSKFLARNGGCEKRRSRLPPGRFFELTQFWSSLTENKQ